MMFSSSCDSSYLRTFRIELHRSLYVNEVLDNPNITTFFSEISELSWSNAERGTVLKCTRQREIYDESRR